MLSSFIKTWYLGERQLSGKVLLGVTSKALPALEANAGLANEFQQVQHPEDHLGPPSVTLHLHSPHTCESRRRGFRSPPASQALQHLLGGTRAQGPRAELWPERAWAKQDKTQGATAGQEQSSPAGAPAQSPHLHFSPVQGTQPRLSSGEQTLLLLIQDLQVGFFQLFCFDDLPNSSARETKIPQTSK